MLKARLLTSESSISWGAISDQEFKQEFQALDRERRILETKQQPVETPNLDRAAALLTELPALWEHPGVNDTQRRELVREVFEEVRLRGKEIGAVKPKPAYVPLFAYTVLRKSDAGGVGVSGFEPPTSASQTLRAKPTALHPAIEV